jgi:hypothetical protein
MGGLLVTPVKLEFSSPPQKRGLVDRRSFGYIAARMVALTGGLSSEIVLPTQRKVEAVTVKSVEKILRMK